MKGDPLPRVKNIFWALLNPRRGKMPFGSRPNECPFRHHGGESRNHHVHAFSHSTSLCSSFSAQRNLNSKDLLYVSERRFRRGIFAQAFRSCESRFFFLSSSRYYTREIFVGQKGQQTLDFPSFLLFFWVRFFMLFSIGLWPEVEKYLALESILGVSFSCKGWDDGGSAYKRCTNMRVRLRKRKIYMFERADY